MATAAGSPILDEQMVPRADRESRVVVFAVPDDTESLLSQFQQRLGITALDARIRLHALPGILPDTLSPQDAEALVGAIQQLGVDAQVLAAADCPDLSHAATVHHVRCSEFALEIVPNPGTAIESIGWDRVGVISVADVPLDGVHHATAPRTVMVRSSPRKNDAEVTTPLHGVEMWIVCENPFRGLRIDHRAMNYEYLGPAISGSGELNFRSFAKDLVAHAWSAHLTPPARAFLAGAAIDRFRLDSQTTHRRLVEYHCILRRRIRQQVGTTSMPDLVAQAPEGSS
jgi:hypothetical protein